MSCVENPGAAWECVVQEDLGFKASCAGGRECRAELGHQFARLEFEQSAGGSSQRFADGSQGDDPLRCGRV